MMAAREKRLGEKKILIDGEGRSFDWVVGTRCNIQTL